MQKKFITNLAFLLFLNLLIKPFWILGIDREVQNAIGSEDYGLYFALFNFSFLLNSLLDIGLTNFNNRNIAQNEHLLGKHFSNIVSLKLFLGIIYILITIVAALVFNYNYYEIFLLLILSFNQFLISFVLYLRSNISGLHMFKTDSFISVLDRLIMIVICSVLLWTNITDGKFKIEWYIYTQTAGYGITALTAFFVVYKKAGIFKLYWNPSFYISILKKSLPYAILILLMTIYTRSDSVLIERILGDEGPEQSGIYAQSYRLLDAANMIAYLFSSLLLPIFAKMIKQKEKVNQMVNLSLSIILSMAILTAVGSYFYSNELMAMLYEHHVLQSAQIFGIMMFCFVAMSTTYIFGTLLTANDSLKVLNIISGSGVIMNIILNLILVPKYKAYGAAMSGLITQSYIAISQAIMAGRIFKFGINYKLIFTIAAFTLGTAVIAYYSKNIHFDWRVNFVVMVISSISWAFLIRMVSVRAIYRILKYE
jgi:O-antigen/teichoic acid export membrane protein